MRQGNFSELLVPGNIFYSSRRADRESHDRCCLIQEQLSSARSAAQLSPNGIGLLNAYPVPNLAGNPASNWTDTALYTERQRKDSVVVDFVPAEAHHFRFSLLNYNYDDYEPHFGNFNTNPRIFHRPNQIGVFHYTWTVSPTMVNDAYVSGAADHVDINIDTSSGLLRSHAGTASTTRTSSAPLPRLVPNKIPTMQLSSFGTLDGGPYPSRSGGIVYDVGDTLTKVWGNHTLKFGGVWEYAGENNYDQISVDNTRPGTTNNQNGLFVFTDARGGGATSKAAVANVALGLFDTYGEIGQRSYTPFRGNMYEMFGQDQWRVNSKLVLEYGIRYSIMMPYHSLWGNQAFFSPKDYNPALAPTVNPTTGFLTGGDQYNGVVIPGSGFPSAAKGHVPDNILNGGYQRLFRGYGSGYSPTVYSNIQPRFGFAYQIDPGTVFRAGVGRYIQRLGISDTVHVGGNAPFQPAAGVSQGSVDNPGGIGVNTPPLAFTSHAFTYPSPEAWAWNMTVEHEFYQRRNLHAQLCRPPRLPPGTVGKHQPASARNHTGEPHVKSPDALRPLRASRPSSRRENTGGSFYHAMQANVKRRLTKGFLFGVAYTWSKSLDYGSSNGTNITNAYDNSIMFGPSDFDTRHVLVTNYVWDIPFATNSTNRFARTTARRLAVLRNHPGAIWPSRRVVSRNLDQAGVGPGSGNQYYVTTRSPNLPHQFGTAGQYFEVGTACGPSNTTCLFQPAAAGTFAGRGSRNNVYGPGFSSFNAALQKGFHIIPEP